MKHSTIRQRDDFLSETEINAEQVNIAADGGQQVNVQNKGKKKGSARSKQCIKRS